MTKKLFLLTFIAGALAFMQAPVMAQDSYFSLEGAYTDDDVDRIVDDGFSGIQLAFGHYLSEKFAIEGRLGIHELEGAGDLDLTEFGLNGRWSFRRDETLSPFVLIGLGMLDVNSDLFGNTQTLYTNAGVGLDWNIGDGPGALRLEHRYRSSNDGPDFTDTITSLGFVYRYGSERAAMPLPVAAPADPDSDGDGVPDSRDDCPNTPAGHRVDSRGCSLDSDGDGVADADDACPNTVRGAAVDARGCEMDDDNDGVVNRLDECPNTAAGAKVDTKGCEIQDVIELPGVNFETNSDRLLPGVDGVLRDAAVTLQRYPELVVEVAGHTDSQGAADYNQGLSERRAATVRDYLINAGVSEGNLSSKGYGEAEPVADNGTADGRASNRRVELRIIGE